MFGTFQKKFVAAEEMSLTIHADGDGRFEKALQAIFANGLPELADSVPIYWKCYAQGYFVDDTTSGEPDRVVERCVAARSLAKASNAEAGEDDAAAGT